MGYVENNLMKDEKVVYSTTHHWIIYAGAVIVLVFGIWLFASGIASAIKDNNGAAPVPAIFGFCIIFGSIFLFIGAAIQMKTNEFAVTNKRIIIKIGLIRRSTLELNLDKVESVGVDQSILGRILNYGTITISGTGSTRQPYKTIAAPMDFKKAVQS
jgi:uncharacterized membrane protein YdbT with pleckstrin-like domain